MLIMSKSVERRIALQKKQMCEGYDTSHGTAVSESDRIINEAGDDGVFAIAILVAAKLAKKLNFAKEKWEDLCGTAWENAKE